MGKPETTAASPARPTRDRLIAAAGQLFQRQGLAATGIKEILDLADATFSSLYHHFPDGKDQLSEETIRVSGAAYQQLVELVWDGQPDATSAVAALYEGVAVALEMSDFADACPIGTVALEVASTNERLRVAANTVFTAWTASAARRLAAAGLSEDTATDLAATVITLLEGAFVLARTAKSTDAMRRAGRVATTLVAAALHQHRE